MYMFIYLSSVSIGHITLSKGTKVLKLTDLMGKTCGINWLLDTLVNVS